MGRHQHWRSMIWESLQTSCPGMRIQVAHLFAAYAWQTFLHSQTAYRVKGVVDTSWESGRSHRAMVSQCRVPESGHDLRNAPKSQHDTGNKPWWHKIRLLTQDLVSSTQTSDSWHCTTNTDLVSGQHNVSILMRTLRIGKLLGCWYVKNCQKLTAASSKHSIPGQPHFWLWNPMPYWSPDITCTVFHPARNRWPRNW